MKASSTKNNLHQFPVKEKLLQKLAHSKSIQTFFLLLLVVLSIWIACYIVNIASN